MFSFKIFLTAKFVGCASLPSRDNDKRYGGAGESSDLARVTQWTQMVMNVVSLIEAANPSLTSCTLAQLLRPFMRRNQRSTFGYAE